MPPPSIPITLLTYNLARTPISPPSFASHLSISLSLSHAHSDSQTPSNPQADLLVLSLQELAPLANSFLGGSFLEPYLNPIRAAVALSAEKSQGSSEADGGYEHVITRNVGMTAIMVFVRKSKRNWVRGLRTAGVGCGVQEMGNKGAVGVRLLYGRDGDEEGTWLTFVAAHLAPMEDAMERRNEDWQAIVEGTCFADEADMQLEDGVEEHRPLLQSIDERDTKGSRGIYHPRSHLFVAGDLNYRTSSTKPKDSDVAHFPQPKASPSDPHHFSTLLEHDQLREQLDRRKTLHGLTEPAIHFLPTYKLLDSHDGHDEWATHRWPSWCDRIVYLPLPQWMEGDAQTTVHKYDSLPLLPTSDHRAVFLSLSVPTGAIPQPSESLDRDSDVRLSPPYSIQPGWEARRAMARRKEIAVGLAAYLGWTWEGNGLLLAVVVGGLGGWVAMKSFI